MTQIANRRTARLFFGAAMAALASAALASPEDFFEQKIRPVLADKCYGCHSSATDAVKGELMLDSLDAAAKGGKSGLAAVVAGDPSTSRLLEAIRYKNPDLQMPPKEQLSDTVIADFEQWIRDGAVFPKSDKPLDLMAKAKQHWAFHPPTPQSVPAVSDIAWPRAEVDYFVLAALEAKGLGPAPEADRRTLIRRLSFGLLGLPPVPEEVDAFVNDRDPQAYEKLVERYLASPHYGERWARHWLDVARYADTKGYVYGGREEVKFTHSHVYRDWVVNALNRDLPYDQFVRLQLAADTLTNESTRSDLAAMGFLTLGQRFLGVMPDIVDDKIDTVTRGLMGLTVSCARCHDHKFDPVPTADYYSLYGVFNASSERTVALNPAAIEDPKYAAFAEEMKKRQQVLQDRFEQEKVALETRLRTQSDRYLAAVPTASSLPTDEFYEIRNEDDVNPTIVRRWASFIAQRGEQDPVFGPWNRLAQISGDQFATGAKALLASYTAGPQAGDVVLAASSELDAPEVNPAVLAALGPEAPATFDEAAARYGAAFKSVEDEWAALVASSAGSGIDAPTALPDPAREALRQILMMDGSPIRVPEGAIIDLEWMFAEPARVELGRLNAEIDRWINGAEIAPDYSVILADKPEMNPPRIFGRGNPANPGPVVPRQFLELLSGPERKPFANGSGRREMADAIASADNPLTARVFVNRVWGWHFGRGLVETPSDFGTRAPAPSHPELLDWLAQRFVADGWSLKQLHRHLVLSATYRQSSDAPAEDPRVAKAALADPENSLLWHFNRYRLDFESLRDAVLFASGEIDLNLGGRPVELASAPYPVRRTLYGRVDRQFLPGVFRVFDFPNPDMHSPGRLDTTVPQQALYFMNNPFVQDQARAFAAKAEATVATADAARVEWLYRQAYQRAATAEQVARSLDYIHAAEGITPPPPPEIIPSAWSYGYGKIDPATNALASFTELPFYTGTEWQGGANYPDPGLGWLKLHGEGGHPGNTLDHAVVRRWTAPAAGKVQITGRIKHEPAEGDGIMARVISSRHGLLGAWSLHASESDANFYGIAMEAGDTIDFEVDVKGGLNSDQYLWAPVVTMMDPPAEGAVAMAWDAKAEFGGPQEPTPVPLAPWEKYAQVLLSSNEFMFVD
jgi:hypothetical protein